ncbi:MAG: VWA domain-containing protein [bacterium]
MSASATRDASPAIADAEARFEAAWPEALTALSPFTRLPPPIWCKTPDDEQREGLVGSFAMIRMKDDRIVVSLRQVVERDLVGHAKAILAHEVGHYVHAPGTLEDQVRLLDRIRRTLPPELSPHAGLVANLYTDLLLNDRLQRSGAADVAAVYAALKSDDAGELWSFYARTYERLWALPKGALTAPVTSAIDIDADLAARLVRVFRDRWLDGAASFALLVERYLPDLPKQRGGLPPWLDTVGVGAGDRVPDGFTRDDFDPASVRHPMYDERINGSGEKPAARDQRDARGKDATGADSSAANGRALVGDGRADGRSVTRGPQEWLDLMRAAGVTREPKDLVGRYYRELAMPHVIPFPSQRIERAGDPLPEGLEVWESGSPLERIDWNETLIRSPVVIPGLTTVERSFGTTEGGEPERRVPDLYVGIDCSGSMGNPAAQLSYPVLAGVVLTLSALRAGARVMACLSGEWHGAGTFTASDGFVRDERKLLGVLTDYLGTGASFGLPRLVEAFVAAPRRTRPAHVLVVSDSDLFGEIEGTRNGWELARRATERAGGGATAVLRLDGAAHHAPWLEKLAAAGFEPHVVASQEELVSFARAFARRKFELGGSP